MATRRKAKQLPARRVSRRPSAALAKVTNQLARSRANARKIRSKATAEKKAAAVESVAGLAGGPLAAVLDAYVSPYASLAVGLAAILGGAYAGIPAAVSFGASTVAPKLYAETTTMLQDAADEAI